MCASKAPHVHLISEEQQMSKSNVAKDEFYNEVVDLIEQARKSVHFYSISCCFGFYSFGVKNFERVLIAIKNRIKLKISGEFLDVRVLIKIDGDNPMDVYAAQRLASLQEKYAHTGDGGKPRKIFGELIENSIIQFLIIDGERVLSSNTQEEQYNEDLDLVLNISQNGVLFDKDDDKDKFSQLSSIFASSWEVAIPLEAKQPRFSRRQLRFILESYTGIRPAKTEREFVLMLLGYLKGQIDPSMIDVEATLVDSRIDLLVGPEPHTERSGVEVKFKPTDNDIDQIVGQLRKYRNKVVDLILVVGAPDFTPKGRARLLKELTEIDVPLIEC